MKRNVSCRFCLFFKHFGGDVNLRKTGISPDLCHFSTTSRPLASPEPWPIPRGPAGELLSLDFLRPENIRDTLHAYRTGQALRREAGHAPGALDEFHGPRGDFYQNMFAKCPAGRPGAADEAANAAELLVSSKGAFLSGSPLSSSTAGCFYGPLKPEA